MKSRHDLALEVLSGMHGNGHSQRRQSLKVSRNDYRIIHSIVSGIVTARELRTTRKPTQKLPYEIGYEHGYIDGLKGKK